MRTTDSSTTDRPIGAQLTRGDAPRSPATAAMISMQVAQTEQTTTQAAFQFVGTVGAMPASLVFTTYFFDINAKGWR